LIDTIQIYSLKKQVNVVVEENWFILEKCSQFRLLGIFIIVSLVRDILRLKLTYGVEKEDKMPRYDEAMKTAIQSFINYMKSHPDTNRLDILDGF